MAFAVADPALKFEGGGTKVQQLATNLIKHSARQRETTGD